MLNQTGVVKQSGITRKTILIDEQNSTALSCIYANTGITADSNGKKIIKAGTPVTGSLVNRQTPFTVAKDSGEESSKVSNAVGVALHDVDVTSGNANGQVLIFGFIDKSKLESDVQSLVTVAAEKALNMIKYVV